MTKLIRDKVAIDIMRLDPNRVGIIEGLDNIKNALNNKIIEEALELSRELDEKEVDKDNITEEAADIIEVIYAICDFYDIDTTDLFQTVLSKAKIKGRFLSYSCLLSD